MHNEYVQNISTVQVLSLMLLDKLTLKHNKQILQLCIAEIIAEMDQGVTAQVICPVRDAKTCLLANYSLPTRQSKCGVSEVKVLAISVLAK